MSTSITPPPEPTMQQLLDRIAALEAEQKEQTPWIVRWFKSRNITSHTAAATITSGALIFATDEQVRSYAIKVFAHHPNVVVVITAATTLWLKYSGAHSNAGVIQEAAKVSAGKNG